MYFYLVLSILLYPYTFTTELAAPLVYIYMFLLELAFILIYLYFTIYIYFLKLAPI